MADEALNFVLAVDPDLADLNKAIEQVNAEIDRDRIMKIKADLMPADVLPVQSTMKKAMAGFAEGGMGGAAKSLFGSLQEHLMGSGAGKAASAAGGAASGGMDSLLGAAMGGAEAGGAGAAAGALAGGPVTLIATAVKEAAKAIGPILAAPVKVINAGLGAMATGLNELQGPLGPIGAGLTLAGDAMKGFSDMVHKIPIVGDLLGPLLDQFAAMPGIVKDITTALVSMAGKASPAAFKMFQIAVEDVQGVIGDTFLPILEEMREGVRFVGDALASILPNAEEVGSALHEAFAAFDELREALRDLFTEVGPLIRQEFMGALKTLSAYLSVVAGNIKMVVQALGAMLRPLMGLLGIQPEARSSEGAAARPASFSGIDEYQKRLQTAAFSEPGRVTMGDVPNLLKDKLGAIEKALTETLPNLLDPTKWLPAAYDAIQGRLPSVSSATEIVEEKVRGGLERGARTGLNMLGLGGV